MGNHYIPGLFQDASVYASDMRFYKQNAIIYKLIPVINVSYHHYIDNLVKSSKIINLSCYRMAVFSIYSEQGNMCLSDNNLG